MLKTSFILALALSCFSGQALAKVYDLAGIMTNERRISVDSEITNYQEKTEIIITVLTMGKEDERFLIRNPSDNEIILTFIPSKKFSGAEVGSALRHWLTNNYASIIVRRNVFEAVLDKDYAYGIESSVKDITEKLGSQSMTERIAQIVESNQKGDKVASVLISAFLWTITLLSFLLTVFFIFSRNGKLRSQRNKKSEKFASDKAESEQTESKPSDSGKVEACESVEDELVR